MAEKKVTENEAAPKKTVKKTITKVDSAKATTPAEKPSTKTAAKAATPVTAADKSSAKTKRILDGSADRFPRNRFHLCCCRRSILEAGQPYGPGFRTE